MQVTVFPSRLAEAFTVGLKYPEPLLVLLSAGKESWAFGVPPSHRQWYCSSASFSACKEHTGRPEGLSVQQQI